MDKTNEITEYIVMIIVKKILRSYLSSYLSITKIKENLLIKSIVTVSLFHYSLLLHFPASLGKPKYVFIYLKFNFESFYNRNKLLVQNNNSLYLLFTILRQRWFIIANSHSSGENTESLYTKCRIFYSRGHLM